MEEQILKIINNPQYCPERSAKEIAEHFERFMEWWMFGGHPFTTWNDECGNYLTDEITDKRYTIAELYSYWNEHINNEKI